MFLLYFCSKYHHIVSFTVFRDVMVYSVDLFEQENALLPTKVNQGLTVLMSLLFQKNQSEGYMKLYT